MAETGRDVRVVRIPDVFGNGLVQHLPAVADPVLGIQLIFHRLFPERILKDVVVVLCDDQKTMLISAVGENLQKRVDFIVVEICLVDEAAVEPDGSAADADGVEHQVGAEMKRQKIHRPAGRNRKPHAMILEPADRRAVFLADAAGQYRRDIQ